MQARTFRQPPVTMRVFTQRFSSTRLGARLARHLGVHQLDAWGVPYGTAEADTAALVIAELASNAALHGRLPGRDFELRLTLTDAVLRVEVSDARGGERPPDAHRLAPPAVTEDAGRGLLLVDGLADRWTVLDRVPVGKTVRAEIDRLPSPPPGAPGAGGVRSRHPAHQRVER